MLPIRPRPDLRYHAARWRAVAGLQHDPPGEAARGARARRARRRRHRGRLPGRLARGLRERRTRWRARCRARPSAASPAATADDIELAARALAGAARRRIHVFLATSAIHRQYKLNMAQEEILRLAADGVRPRARAVRGRGVLARGCLAHRARVPRAGGRGGDRRRRQHRQHSRHGRLHRAGRVRRAVPLPAQERARHREACACRCTATTTSAWRSPTA